MCGDDESEKERLKKDNNKMLYETLNVKYEVEIKHIITTAICTSNMRTENRL